MKITPKCRRFHLDRTEDVTGVSGTGRVAEGFVASDGKVALRWLSACGSWVLYDNADALLQVHGHHGATKIVWDDGAPEVDGSARAALEEAKAALASFFSPEGVRSDWEVKTRAAIYKITEVLGG